MSLKDYKRKRNFDQTNEPIGVEPLRNSGHLKFVVQMHHARNLHYDFRIEAGGTLKSWAVPKGPSMDASIQRLAVHVEDHPISYGKFEGVIPHGNYGAGRVVVWDQGTYIERNSKGREDSDRAILKGIEEGHITFVLEGEKLRGEFALVKTKGEKSWLLIKKRDEFAIRPQVIQPPPEKSKAVRSVLHTEQIPRKFKPMLATPWPTPFEQDGWIFEAEFGGHRAIAEIDRGNVRLHSRQFLPFHTKYPKIVEELRQASALITAVLDGEIFDHTFWVRDIIHLQGSSLRDCTLEERLRRLGELPLFGSTVQMMPNARQSAGLLEEARNKEYPSILARDANSKYHSGTSKDWKRISVTSKASGDELKPRLTHLEKVYWPQEKITKGDLIEYYQKVAPMLVDILKDRPQSMHRHPEGIEAASFFHKDLTEHHPRFVHTERIYSRSTDKSINYLLCQNEATLLYMANLGCIELNPWLSRVGSLGYPDAIVIDLDPSDSNSFSDVTEVARETCRILEKVGAPHVCKTSGSSGLHIFIPTGAKYGYEQGRNFAIEVCQVLAGIFPDNTSLDRNPSKRKKRIYLDCFQNAEGQTVASVYCVRPKPGAPVSTPLLTKELTARLNPDDFTLKTVPKRVDKLGDLWLPVLKEECDLEACLSRLRKNFPIGK